MFAHVLLLVSLSAAFASPVLPGGRAIEARIIGGEAGNITEVPYVASVLFDDRHFCGGSIINNFWVVTAAHCVIRTADRYTIRVGSSLSKTGGSLHTVEALHRHPSFRFPDTFSNDIALLKVAEEFQFSEQIQPVPLPAHLEEVTMNAVSTIAGFGMVKWLNGGNSDTLQIAYLRTVPRLQCQLSLLFFGTVSDEMICAHSLYEHIHFCQGDDGGPLFSEGKLRGIMSWGRDCGMKGTPSVYTNVAVFVKWIEGITGL